VGIFVQIVKLVPLIVTAVKAVESLTTGKKGKEKQEAAVDMVRDLLPLIEGYVGADVFDDAQVQAAVREAIDAVVALQNTVEAVKKAKTKTPLP